MEMVREYVDAKKIMSIISLPESMKNRRLEIIIFPAEEKSGKEPAQIESLVDSLIGAIPVDRMTLEEYRAERLKKYQIVD